MITGMTQVEVLGRSHQLDSVLSLLQRRKIAEVVQASGPVTDAVPAQPQLDLVTAVLGYATEETGAVRRARFDEQRTLAAAVSLLPALQELHGQDQSLAGEAAALDHQVAVLEVLESLVPDLAALSDAELQVLGLATVALVLDDPDRRVVSLLEQQLTELLADRFLLVSTAPADPQLAQSTKGSVGCLLVLPRTALPEVQGLLGADRIARVSMPQAYAGRSLHATVAMMRERLAALPAERARVAERSGGLMRPHLAALHGLLDSLRARAEREQAAQGAVRTARTFSVLLWVPTPRLPELNRLLKQESVVIAQPHRAEVRGEPPVLLRTRPSWGPYQRLVTFLSWPAPGGVDPSALMAVALPFLFGVMVGDVVYGVVLMALGWWLRRRQPAQVMLADAGRVLLAGGAWATVFGLLFGEALGSLGRSLGMPALWFYRGGPEALQPLLLFALALGAAHIVLGLLLGVWSAARQRQLGRFADRGGTLLVLVGLFAVVGVLAGAAPAGLLTPAVIGVVIGVVATCASHGAMGLLLGPLELLGVLGNVLSYLRVAAVGLASVYLANVANVLGASAPLLLGILIATLLHVLNLAMAAFSPTVQALRLHYVEFFGTFYDGGGRPFTPLGHALEPLPGQDPLSASAADVPPAVPDRVRVGAAAN